MGCPQSFNDNVFLFVGFIALGTLLSFDFIKLSVQMFQPLIVIYKGVILCIIIRDVLYINLTVIVPFRTLINLLVLESLSRSL